MSTELGTEERQGRRAAKEVDMEPNHCGNVTGHLEGRPRKVEPTIQPSRSSRPLGIPTRSVHIWHQALAFNADDLIVQTCSFKMYLQVAFKGCRYMRHTRHFPTPDAMHPSGRAIAEVKFGVDAVRSVRIALLDLAMALSEYPEALGYLVLIEPTLTPARIAEEWECMASILNRDVVERLIIGTVVDDQWIQSVPREPTPEFREWILETVRRSKSAIRGPSGRPDFAFIVQKLLLYQSLVLRTPVSVSWLGKAAGCSYPTLARVLQSLGSSVERTSDRRVSLRFMPDSDLSAVLSLAERSRVTRRFSDRSGQPRSPEQHVQRLERIGVQGVALGGTLAARHYCPALDLIGTPRLDLCIHMLSDDEATGLVRRLDPALEPERDPRKPAHVVLHSVPHANSLFEQRRSGLAWADPIECLFDLYEARLEAQTREFVSALRTGAVSSGFKP